MVQLTPDFTSTAERELAELRSVVEAGHGTRESAQLRCTELEVQLEVSSACCKAPVIIVIILWDGDSLSILHHISDGGTLSACPIFEKL